ncbi:MAG: pyruvate dehydrogenase complex dihydrolipoamide acetyltransferase [Myxococcales bacterium]|nr:pyruvate dehydrogenase complex dihydrolipoamide acetyltransferase [Myxococcales bacterium]
MATTIVMPQLSPTMEEGVLLKWTKKVGDKINPGDVIAEVETDKANMDFTLEDEGTLLELLVKEGDTVKLGAPVAILGEPGEVAATATPGVRLPLPLAGEGRGEGGAPTEIKPEVTTKIERTTAQAEDTGRVRSSPLARKIAAERGVDLRSVAGSGPGGRIVQRDVVSVPLGSRRDNSADAVKEVSVAVPVAAQPSPLPSPASGRGGEGDQKIPLSLMRKTIARRLVEAKTTIPHFYLTMEADAEPLWAFHRQIKAATDEKITLNDLCIKALAVALARVPAANSSWSADGLLRYGRVDIGVAVSVEDGLITPVVRNAHLKSIGAIARETRDLVVRARARKLKPEEFSGGTFSISNMGMYGVREFSAIINPPEAGILAIGAIDKRATVITDGASETIAIRRRMNLTLSCDHRVIDGALGAELLREIVRVIEKPIGMVL